MLKNFIRPVLYNATRHLKIQPFNNFHPLWHMMPKFYFFQYEKSLIYRFLNYENEIKKLEEATESPQNQVQYLDSYMHLIHYLKDLLPSYLNRSEDLTYKYFHQLNQFSIILGHHFAMCNFSSQNKYILTADKFFNENSMQYLEKYDILSQKIYIQKHKFLKLIIEGAKLDLIDLHDHIKDNLLFYDYLEELEVPNKYQEFLLREAALRIYFLFIISRIFKQRGDKSEEERFFEDALIELKKYSHIAIAQNQMPLKSYLSTIFIGACNNLLLYKDKEKSDSFNNFIDHLFDIAEILDDESLRICITQLHIDYLLIQHQEVDIDVFNKLCKITRENDFCNKEITLALLSRSILMNQKDQQAKQQLRDKIILEVKKIQSQQNIIILAYHQVKYMEVNLTCQTVIQDYLDFDEQIDLLLQYLKCLNYQSQGNAPDYDFYPFVLPVVLQRNNFSQQQKEQVPQKLISIIQEFQKIQPKSFNGSKQQLENQYYLTFLLFCFQTKESLAQQSSIQEYKKFIIQFMEIDGLAYHFFTKFIDLNAQILQQKEHAEELNKYIPQAIQKAKQLNCLENKDQIIQQLDSQLNEAKKLMNQK